MGVTAKRWKRKSRTKRMELLQECGLSYHNARQLYHRDYEDLPYKLRRSIAMKLKKRK
jgi:hypothetical protein